MERVNNLHYVTLHVSAGAWNKPQFVFFYKLSYNTYLLINRNQIYIPFRPCSTSNTIRYRSTLLSPFSAVVCFSHIE
jgi:hypothetical protein